MVDKNILSVDDDKDACASISAPDDQAQKGKAVPEDAIRLHAFWNWTLARKPEGQGIKFWLEAEQQLLQLRDWTLARKPEGEVLRFWLEAEQRLLQSK